MKRSRPKKFDLTIVIPALHEERRIGATLDELARFLKTDETVGRLHVEVLVVAADTTDRTHAIVLAQSKNFEHLQLLKPGPRVGKGRDVQYGMLRAQGAAIIFMDADLATPLRHIPRFYKAFLRNYEVIIGTRNLFKHHKSSMRRLLSNTGNMLFRIAGGLWIEDSQCGFKMFSQAAAQQCFGKLRIMKWGFDMEVLAIAKANRYRIKAYRINDWRSVPDGTFESGVIANAFESLGELARILWRRMRNEYRD